MSSTGGPSGEDVLRMFFRYYARVIIASRVLFPESAYEPQSQRSGDHTWFQLKYREPTVLKKEFLSAKEDPFAPLSLFIYLSPVGSRGGNDADSKPLVLERWQLWLEKSDYDRSAGPVKFNVLYRALIMHLRTVLIYLRTMPAHKIWLGKRQGYKLKYQLHRGPESPDMALTGEKVEHFVFAPVSTNSGRIMSHVSYRIGWERDHLVRKSSEPLQIQEDFMDMSLQADGQSIARSTSVSMQPPHRKTDPGGTELDRMQRRRTMSIGEKASREPVFTSVTEREMSYLSTESIPMAPSIQESSGGLYTRQHRPASAAMERHATVANMQNMIFPSGTALTHSKSHMEYRHGASLPDENAGMSLYLEARNAGFAGSPAMKRLSDGTSTSHPQATTSSNLSDFPRSKPIDIGPSKPSKPRGFFFKSEDNTSFHGDRSSIPSPGPAGVMISPKNTMAMSGYGYGDTVETDNEDLKHFLSIVQQPPPSESFLAERRNESLASSLAIFGNELERHQRLQENVNSFADSVLGKPSVGSDRSAGSAGSSTISRSRTGDPTENEGSGTSPSGAGP
eukprot:Clim_evm65s109 gene=Clim_evmTU65s109